MAAATKHRVNAGTNSSSTCAESERKTRASAKREEDLLAQICGLEEELANVSRELGATVEELVESQTRILELESDLIDRDAEFSELENLLVLVSGRELKAKERVNEKTWELRNVGLVLSQSRNT